MSVRLSKLKQSKVIVYEYLKNKYPNKSFVLFYSIGEQKSDYTNQCLKIETDIENSKWSGLKKEVEDFLIGVDEHYIGLNIKVTKINYNG